MRICASLACLATGFTCVAAMHAPCATAVADEARIDAAGLAFVRGHLSQASSSIGAPVLAHLPEAVADTTGMALAAVWDEAASPRLFIRGRRSGQFPRTSVFRVDFFNSRMFEEGHAPYVGDRWPYQLAVLPAPPDFVFFIPAFGDGLPDLGTMVFRRNPGGLAVQAYGSVNRAFLCQARFAAAARDEGDGIVLRVVDGLGEGLGEVRLRAEVGRHDALLATVPTCSGRAIWGCVGSTSRAPGEAGSAVRRWWPYRLLLPEDAGEVPEVEAWELRLGQKLVGNAQDTTRASETVSFLPPSLSTSPETGLAVWRKRTISSEEEQANARIYELIHWTPEREKLVGLYAEYRGPDGERSWRFDDQGEWIERPYIRWPQIAEKLGVEPWPVCAISPDGKQILYTCACDLRVVGVPD
jgi:hypothetical protein